MLELLYQTRTNTALTCIALLVLSVIANRVLTSYRIRRLGVRAPRVHGWLLFDIDIVISSIRHSAAHLDLEFWSWIWSHGKPTSPTVEFPIGGQRFIFTAEPENIKAILATQFADYGKGETFHRDWKDFLGDGIFATDGDLWHNSRQLMRPQFIKSRVSDLEIFEKHSAKLISLLGGKGQEVEVSELFYRFTLDTAMEYLLGHTVHSLDEPDNEYAAAFAEIQRVQNIVSRIGPLARFIPRASLHASLKVLNSFVEPIIDQCLRLDPSTLKENENQSFLHALAATGTRDRQVIRDQIVNVLLAGRDTTAGTLSFLFYELSQHPEMYAKLRKEIIMTVGSEQRPTYENIKGMAYLQHCMSETLRLYPSVPFNVRVALKDTTLPTGGGPDGTQPIGVLKDTPIGYSVLYLHRRADLYPPPSPESPAADVFSPERWETWQPKAWHYLPFNGGPRICIGQQFALTEMGYTVVRILQHFEKLDRYWIPNDGPVMSCDVVLSPTQGVKVGFWDAKR